MERGEGLAGLDWSVLRPVTDILAPDRGHTRTLLSAADSACALPVDQYRTLLLHACMRECNCSTSPIDFEAQLCRLIRLVQIAALSVFSTLGITTLMRPEGAAHLHIPASSLLVALAAHKDMQGICLRRRTYCTGEVQCNKCETQVRRFLPVSCVLSLRADLEDVSFVCGIQQTANANSFDLGLRFRRSILA